MKMVIEPADTGKTIRAETRPDGTVRVGLVDDAGRVLSCLTVTAGGTGRPGGGESAGPDGKREYTVFGIWDAGDPVPQHVVAGHPLVYSCDSGCAWVMPVRAVSEEAAPVEAMVALGTAEQRPRTQPEDPVLAETYRFPGRPLAPGEMPAWRRQPRPDGAAAG